MIITIRDQVSSEERSQLAALLYQITGNARPTHSTIIEAREVIVLDDGQLDTEACTAIRNHSAVERIVQVRTPYQLVSAAFKAEKSIIQVGDASRGLPVSIGGDTQPVVIAGPCAVESREQLLETAQAVKAAGAQILRGGAFKPRTSPYQFQGLGLEGLQLLAEARELTGLPVITEVMEPEMVEPVAEYADILQIGSRNMQNFPLLFAAGRDSRRRPVMLKRGFAATIDEWLLAAEYIVAAGNPNVILCERGIRSFDTHTRNLLDLACIPLLRTLTHLPVIVDPSHGTGRRELVPTMSRAGIAAGADGLILEVHRDPNSALCDGRQSITPEQLQAVVHETHIINQLLGRKMLVA
ncbi:MAG TPA: 3-deoxy-7-phosphoheptulonate synthase [Ktedonobacteraceae bacterium]|jgi:3-deoxy-7-phosphoheptulonate synthase|nr:3-deoxy-7-phosphoheptulonate synthase [Ktedonobacteraceae bacterium]